MMTAVLGVPNVSEFARKRLGRPQKQARYRFFTIGKQNQVINSEASEQGR